MYQPAINMVEGRAASSISIVLRYPGTAPHWQCSAPIRAVYFNLMGDACDAGSAQAFIFMGHSRRVGDTFGKLMCMCMCICVTYT